ncbi:hypothetical protein V6N13_020762 [Hibiscus sabdariffa]
MPRDNSQETLLPFVSEIERLFHQKRRRNKANRTIYSANEPVGGEQNQNAAVDQGVAARPRAIRDHLAPMLDDLNPGIVAPEIQAAHFELKLVMFNMLNSIGNSEDHLARMRGNILVHFWKARDWLSGVPSGSMQSWADLCRSFLMRYNPPNMHTQLRNDIASFRQADDESMYECWDRYKGLLRKCNNHGFQDWTQVVMFYDVVNTPTRMMLDASANAQLSAITNMLKNLQKPTEVQDARAVSYVHCDGNHNPNDCPAMHELASYVGNYNRNANNPYSNTYNPGWRQHPNFSWGSQGGGNTSSANRQQNMNAPPGFQTNMPWQSEAKGNASISHNSSLEATMQEFIASTKSLLHDHSISIKNQGNLLQTQGALLQSHGSSLRALENQVGQIAQALQVRPQGGLPSDTEVTKRNGKEQCSKESEVQDKAQEEEGREEVLITKPSGGQCADATAKAVPAQTAEDVRPPPPFPQILKKHKEDTQFKKFVDMLDQLHIDVPFLEAIDQMPTYAKFLKDIITKKRTIERYETVATAKEYFLGDIPPKRNDPGSFIIPCSIGDNYVGKALCDLGSSVN